MIRIKPTSTLLLFVVLLTGWMHFVSSQPPPPSQDPYAQFVNRLKQFVDASGPDILPFLLKGRVFQNLFCTSNDFRDFCIRCEFKLLHNGTYTPIIPLIEAINRTFDHYIHSANTNFLVLESIKSVDPIGFNAYLMQNNVMISSPNFMRYTATFRANMIERLRLHNMKTNDSCFDIFDERNSSTPFNFLPQTISISPIARDEFATEYGPLSNDSMDSITDLFSEKMSTRMYRVGTSVDNYQEHNNPGSDDVQIINGVLCYQEENRETVHVSMHPICVFYQASDMMVHVYGKVTRVKLEDRQQAIIDKLYPFKKGTLCDSRSGFRNKHSASGIYTIMYATMLLLGKRPAKNKIKINAVWGDETLYMRIHILNMLANREVASLK